jgi:hypothetical protein
MANLSPDYADYSVQSILSKIPVYPVALNDTLTVDAGVELEIINGFATGRFAASADFSWEFFDDSTSTTYNGTIELVENMLTFGNVDEGPWSFEEPMGNGIPKTTARIHTFLNSRGELPAGNEFVNNIKASVRTNSAATATMQAFLYEYDPDAEGGSGNATNLLGSSAQVVIPGGGAGTGDLVVRDFAFSSDIQLTSGVDAIVVLGTVSSSSNPRWGVTSQIGAGDNRFITGTALGDDPFVLFSNNGEQPAAWAEFTVVDDLDKFDANYWNRLQAIGLTGTFYTFADTSKTLAQLNSQLFSNQYVASLLKTDDVLLVTGSDGSVFRKVTVVAETRDVTFSTGLVIV